MPLPPNHRQPRQPRERDLRGGEQSLLLRVGPRNRQHGSSRLREKLPTAPGLGSDPRAAVSPGVAGALGAGAFSMLHSG